MKIRIHNDIILRWTILTNGEAQSLEGRSLKVLLCSIYNKTEVDFTIEGNVIQIIYRGKNQHSLGIYSLVLQDTTDGICRTIDECKAFELVPHTHMAAGEDEGNLRLITVNLTSMIYVGDKGEKGDKGDPGKSAYEVAVDNGFVGTEEEWLASLKGERGERGEKGEQGIQGERGETGAQGIQGEKGERGEQGLQGEQGIQGERGEQGIPGINGINGADASIINQEYDEYGNTIITWNDSTTTTIQRGEVGPQGQRGLQGETGSQGSQGEKGEKGDKGEQGAPGRDGADGAPGPQGPQGPQGEVGPQGEQGPQGPQGEKGEKGDKGDSVTMFPAVTIFGQPHIEGTQVNGFSANDYLQFPFVVNFAGRPWTLHFDIATGPDVSQQHNIFDSQFGLAFAFANGHFVMAMSSNGTSWDLGANEGTYAILPNQTYHIRMSWDGQTYKLEWSIDEVEWLTDIQVASTSSLYPRQIVIGKDIFTGTHFYNGSINFAHAQLTIAGLVVWEGMTEVGTATRMALDMSNIDEAGKARLINIVMDGKVGQLIGELKEWVTDHINVVKEWVLDLFRYSTYDMLLYEMDSNELELESGSTKMFTYPIAYIHINGFNDQDEQREGHYRLILSPDHDVTEDEEFFICDEELIGDLPTQWKSTCLYEIDIVKMYDSVNYGDYRYFVIYKEFDLV